MNEPTGMIDNVNHPQHYEGHTSLECIDVMEVAFGTETVAHFCLCNAFKYLWRYKHKNGLEDLKKAEWYLNRYSMITGMFDEQYFKLKELCDEAKQEQTETGHDLESRLEYAFLKLHLSDKRAAKYAGCPQKRAWLYRKNHNIAPRGGAT